MDPKSQVIPPLSTAFLPLLDTLPFFAPEARAMRHKPLCHLRSQRVACAQALLFGLVCKTVRIFAYSSTREQSNKRSEKYLKKKKLASHARRARKTLLHHALPISLLIFRKKNPDCFGDEVGYPPSQATHRRLQESSCANSCVSCDLSKSCAVG